MTEPTQPTPAAMPTKLPNTEAEAAEPADRMPRTPEQYEAELAKVRKEAASYRTKLRAAESDIEQTATQLGAMRRAEVERLAAEHLRDASDLWQAQPDPAAFLNDDGAVDPDKVAEAAQALTANKPHYAADKRIAPPPSDRPVEGLRAGASPEQKVTQPTWSNVIRARPTTLGFGG